MIPNPKNAGIRQAIHVAQGYRGRPGVDRETGKGYGTDDAVFPFTRCSRCGAENSPNADYCKTCAKDLRGEA